MGTPPQPVDMTARMDFLKTIQEPSVMPDDTTWGLFRASVDWAFEEIPNYMFTGLQTKFAFSVKSTATWDKTVKEGGTIESIREMIEDSSGPGGIRAKVRNLFTGKVTHYIRVEDDLGEYIFWRCLDIVLESDVDDISHIMLAVVSEPGKTRTITKGEAALKIVLDAVSQVVTWPLKKVPSSKSGLSKDSQAWELFRSFERMDGNGYREDKDINTSDGQRFKWTHAKIFVSSTDFSEATDHMCLVRARYIGERWMDLCGVPPILRGVVVNTLLMPRWVYFKGIGPLRSIGELVEDNIRRVRLVRGVMMGDPLTKVILHIIGMSVRKIGPLLRNTERLNRYFDNPFQINEVVSEFLKTQR
jgi:hypothetical protein